MKEKVAGGALKGAPPLTIGESNSSEGMTETTILDPIPGAIKLQSQISARSGI
jgi:hypothetical protein